MATDYPIEITTDDGIVSTTGKANFTDPGNQPAPAGPGGGTAPFQPAHNGKVTVIEDFAGDDVLDYDDDAGSLTVGRETGTSLNVLGQIDGQALGPTIAYVTVGTSDPGADYVTPLVVNTTAVTGGSFAWDGSAYQRISAALT